MSRLRRFAFEPFSNWLHILLKLRQLILRGSRSALSIYCLSTAEYRESVPLILRFGTGPTLAPVLFCYYRYIRGSAVCWPGHLPGI